MKLITRLCVVLVALVLLASNASAATTYTCANLTFDVVQSNVWQTVHGDTVNLPAGTNHWISALSITQNISFIGAGPFLGVQYGGGVTNNGVVQNTYTVGATPTVIVCDITNATGHLINFSTVSNLNVCRISGLTIMGGTNTASSSDSLIKFAGQSWMCRIDNCHFWLCRQKNTEFSGNTLGVLDHCVGWNVNDYLTFIGMSSYGGVGANGNFSWASPSSYGKTNQVWIETCIVTNRMGGSGAICDNDSGGRFGVRYTTGSNTFVVTHGTETGQQSRGVYEVEMYKNYMFVDTNNHLSELWDEALYMRSGSSLCYSNYLRGYKCPVKLDFYRGDYGTWNIWGGANGTNNWDTNDTVAADSGTHTGANSGLGDSTSIGVLLDGSKTWTVNQWRANSNGCYVVQDIERPYCYGLITTNDVTHIAMNGIVDSSGINTNFIWFTGDHYRIFLIRAGLDQPGRGQGDYLTNGVANAPANSTLGGIVAWPRQVINACYQWSNVMEWDNKSVQDFGPVGTITRSQSMVRTNIDFYDFVASPYTPLVYPNPLVQPVVPNDPSIDSQPSNQSVTVGQTATFNITASGTATIHYQWKFNGSVVGSDANNYARSNCQLADSGGSVICTVTGPGVNSPQVSSTVTLTVTAAPATGSVLNTLNVINVNIGSLRSP